MDKHFDIILAGGGLAGLTLALELARRPFFLGKKALLIDRDEKEKNDRTWCFWATEDEPLPPVVFKTWRDCRFFSPRFSQKLDIAPYRYHMVRGLDFYRWAKAELAKAPHIQRITANIQSIDADTGIVQTDRGDFHAEHIFNSALSRLPLLPQPSPIYPNPPLSIFPPSAVSRPPSAVLLQHFKGWLLETAAPAFDPDVVTFMDYRLEQRGETRFVYVLPFSPTRALVEFTVFSLALCAAEEYDAQLSRYVREFLKIKDFRVEEEEFGVIPMADLPFETGPEGRVTHIGTVGGFVKASSGYAFKRTQRKLRAFAEAWERSGQPDPSVMRSAWRYRFFDSVMLQALNSGEVRGSDFFTLLFQKLPAHEVFRFLDEDATLLQQARVATAPPVWPFLKAAGAVLR
jgi:lycopene beta-cyclase